MELKCTNFTNKTNDVARQKIGTEIIKICEGKKK